MSNLIRAFARVRKQPKKQRRIDRKASVNTQLRHVIDGVPEQRKQCARSYSKYGVTYVWWTKA